MGAAATPKMIRTDGAIQKQNLLANFAQIAGGKFCVRFERFKADTRR
jgi:hypothetical protein